jgi:hypothetical protein
MLLVFEIKTFLDIARFSSVLGDKLYNENQAQSKDSKKKKKIGCTCDNH